MQISEYNILLILIVIHLYLSVLSIKIILKKPRDWVMAILASFGFVAIGRILNDHIETMHLPTTLILLFFLVYIAIYIKIYYDWKKQKKGKDIDA